jgi:hypothetical protein
VPMLTMQPMERDGHIFSASFLICSIGLLTRTPPSTNVALEPFRVTGSKNRGAADVARTASQIEQS